MEKDLISKLRNKKNFVIFGAGNVAMTVINYLLVEEAVLFSNLSCFCVTSLDNNPHFIYGKRVVSVDDLLLNEQNVTVLVATVESKQSEIIAFLEDNGINDVLAMRDEIYHLWEQHNKDNADIIHSKLYKINAKNWYFQTLERVCEERKLSGEQIKRMISEDMEQYNLNKINMTRLVVVLGSKCSLRCRDCNNLMPYFKPQSDLDKHVIIKSIDNLLKHIERLIICELIGGEPFLANNLSEVLEYVIAQEKILQIEITTNGTIIPKDSLVGLLKDKKVKVRISDYGTLVDKTKIVNWLKQNDIKYEVLNLGNWQSPGGVEKRNRSQNELEKIYTKCAPAYYCKTLYGDKLFACARASSLYALGYMKEDEYLEIEESLDTTRLKEFIYGKCFAACDYCDTAIENPKYVAPAIQIY